MRRGTLVGLVGYHMLQGEQSAVHSPLEEDTENSRDAALDIAISPLAMPVLAGPGTIATAMNFASESTVPEVTRVIAAFAVICAVTWGTFLVGQSLTNFLGQNAIKVVTRLMGLILAVIGVQMLITGIQGAIALARSSA
jgi:multiple antibiotic resistance protein